MPSFQGLLQTYCYTYNNINPTGLLLLNPEGVQ